MSIETTPGPLKCTVGRLRVKLNSCDCHPETCCCRDWAVVWEDGSKHSTHHSEETADQFVAMVNEIEQLKADAARYRWLRDSANDFDQRAPLVFICHPDAPLRWTDARHGVTLDDALDAAMKADQPPNAGVKRPADEQDQEGDGFAGGSA